MVSYFLILIKGVDSVSYDALIPNKQDERTRWYGAAELVQSYLTNREQHLSSKKMITCGLSHGSILGLLLFLFYSNDFPDSLSY